MNFFKILSLSTLVLLASVGSATLLQGFGTVDASVNIEKPLQLVEIYYDSKIDRDKSGEYIVLEARKETIDLSKWNLTSITDGEGENAINYSRKVSSDYIVLVDNSSSVSDIPADWKVFDVGTFPKTGMANSGETFRLGYEPLENVKIDSANYTGYNCNENQSYMVYGSNCQQKTLEVS